MSTMTEVTEKDLHDLLEIFEKQSFNAGSCEEGTLKYEILKKCELLFKEDFSIIELDNTKGYLCTRYPTRLFIPEFEHGHMSTPNTANNTNVFSQNSSTATVTPHGSSGSQNGIHHNPTSSNGSASTSTANNGVQAFVTFANGTTPSQNTSASNSHPYFQTQMQYPQQMTTSPPLSHFPAASTNNVVGGDGGSGYQHTMYEDLYDVGKARELITMAKYARCRQRFGVPVIMYRGKYICRSATVSIKQETYIRKGLNIAFDFFVGTNSDENIDDDDESLSVVSSPFTYDQVINSDIQLLNTLNVTTIVDLMVEKGKTKYGVTVSSSEKADPKNNYQKFNLVSLPYPGCEFFKKFRDNNYMAKNLFYDWNQSFNDAYINVPKIGPIADLNIEWNDYKQWDLVLITQNYLKACLKHIQYEKTGLLIHCISGWDRTPLFISLVRLSLWADGLIHENLNPQQMVYFTLAYDWYLFGHQLPARLRKGEDIMFFCFHMLKYITDEEFSIVEHSRRRTKTSSSSGSSIIVLKNDFFDEDHVKDIDRDMVVVGYDHENSNDSYSNSSYCDMSITDNFFTTSPAPTTTAQQQAASPSSSNSMVMNPLTNRSPNPKRSKTSPISVPGASATRHRDESIFPNSWLMVTETGSIDSMKNGSYAMRVLSQQKQEGNFETGGAYAMVNNGGSIGNGCNGSNTPSNASSFNTSQGSNGMHNGALNYLTNAINDKDMQTKTMRKKRLNAVRTIFIQSYGKTIGLKFKEGSSLNLAGVFGTLAEQLF